MPISFQRNRIELHQPEMRIITNINLSIKTICQEIIRAQLASWEIPHDMPIIRVDHSNEVEVSYWIIAIALQKSTSYTRRLKGAARVFEEILQRKL
jgi:hypothetical protein